MGSIPDVISEVVSILGFASRGLVCVMILFPLFSLIKIFNKLIKKKDIVVSQANASNNILVKAIFEIEKKLSNYSLPFGIRCFVCARKK